MSTSNEVLSIVDDNDQVVGQDTRENIHIKGFQHREVGVWIYNDKGELLLQRRAPDKDIAPNLLDTSAGGHIGIEESYEEAAIKELAEETSIRASLEELTFITKNKRFSGKQPNGLLNKTVRQVFAYHFKEGVDQLQLVDRAISAFEWWPMEKLLNLTDEAKKGFSSFVIKDYPEVYKIIKGLLSK